MKLIALALAFAATVQLTLAADIAVALNQPTHRLVNQAAANAPTFDEFLQVKVGLPHGLLERFDHVPAIFWIGEGGDREDDGIRFLRHFHDPLRPWDKAGLGEFNSSIRWMQGTDQVQGWSWQKARNSYWTALTTVDPSEHQLRWADTFRALGQIMHLVVDASVPEHTRHDPHPLEGICRNVYLSCLGNYEYWVSDQHTKPGTQADFIYTYLSAPTDLDRTILQQPTADLAAPVPIARLIDTDTYTGADPQCHPQ